MSRALSLAGFQVTLIGRFWVTTEVLEMFVSTGCIAAGLIMWVSMNGSNSPVTLLTGAALLVAGVMVFGSTMKTILGY
jgi:hypothetical protein